jgi:hypothetical protein
MWLPTYRADVWLLDLFEGCGEGEELAVAELLSSISFEKTIRRCGAGPM